MSATVLTNARVFDGTEVSTGRAVVIEDDQIVEVSAGAKGGADTQDLAGALLAPGFVDLQVNGGGGVLFNDAPSPATIARIAKAHRRFGTTGFLPTLISADRATMATAIDAVQAAIAEQQPGALGIHLEGPFLNPDRKGAHDTRFLRRPDRRDMELLTEHRQGKTLLTLAPEIVAAADLRALDEAGVIVFAGHTNATSAQVSEAIKLGLRGFTHLFNAMSQITAREPGVVGAALAPNDCWSGVIADEHHVHPTNLRMAVAQKPGRVFLVTDAMPPVGSVEDSFELDGKTVTRHGTRLTLPDGTLAGSCLDMAAAVRNAIERLGIPIAEALRMASAYPAAVLGLDQTLGRIAPGYRADLVALNDSLRVIGTWIGGRYAPTGTG